ncbi:MAG: TolC family protein [Acidobacteriota bacterium]
MTRRSFSMRAASVPMAVILNLLTQAGVGQAQPAAEPVEQLVARALARAPSIAARRTRIDAATTALAASDALPDPMVEFEYRAGGFPRYTIGTEPGSMLGASVRQSLLSTGRRASRRAVADAEIDQSLADLTFWATTLATSVRTLYARLFAIDRERETLEDARELLKMLEATATARYAAGESDQASVLRVQLEQSRLGERIADLENDRVAVQAALNRLMDEPPETQLSTARELPSPAAETGTAAGRISLDGSPEIAVRKAQIAVASERVAAAKQELRPSWSVGVGLFWQGGWDRMATFNVGVELPFWKKRKELPLIAAAEHRKRAAELDLADTSAGLQAEVLRLVEARKTAEAQIGRYESAILPQNSAALDATRTSYLVGRGDFVSVLEEFRNWIEIRVGLARRQADRYAAEVRLAALLAPQTGAMSAK